MTAIFGGRTQGAAGIIAVAPRSIYVVGTGISRGCRQPCGSAPVSLVLLSCARLLGGAVWHFERKKNGKTQHCWRSIYSRLDIGIIITPSNLL